MAYLEGTLEDFYKYLGPRTSDIVTQIARPYRKNNQGNRISCGESKPDGTKCKQYIGLHAAHLKGKERKKLIHDILEDFAEKVSDLTFKIDLQVFESEFEKKHSDFYSVIKFMCPKHHKQYDTNTAVNDLENISFLEDELNDINEIIELKEILDQENITVDYLLTSNDKMYFKVVKSKFAKQYNVSKNQISVANQSKVNGLWNFDVLEEKFQGSFIFIPLLENGEKFRNIKIDAGKLDLSQFSRKGTDKIRFKINSNLIDEKGFDFKPFMADVKEYF